MKKFVSLLICTILLSVQLVKASDYLYTRYDNKYATPLLSQLKDYRTGIHMERGFMVPSRTFLFQKKEQPVVLFFEGGILHELEYSHDITVGAEVGLGYGLSGVAAYNSNTIPTLGNCTTFMLKYNLGK